MNKRKTNEEFLLEVKELYNNEYTFLEPYKTTNTKIKVRHNICNNIYETTPHNFLSNKSHCPKCRNYNKKNKTINKRKGRDFKKEFIDLCNNEGYEIINPNDYVSTKSKLKLKCLKCNNIFEKRISNFKSGERCPYCMINKFKNTNEEVKQEILNHLGEDYILLNDYINNKTKLTLKHLKCNNTWDITLINIKKGKRCPYCYGHRKLNTKEFKNKVKELTDKEYSVIGNYINSNTKIKLKHNKCNNTYEVRPDRFIQGDRCPYCANTKTKDTNWFKNKVKELENDNYIVLSEYINTKTKIKMKHNKCNNEYYVTPNKFIQGRRCPYCKPKSYGELIVNEYLTNNHVSFIQNFHFNDLYYRNPSYPLTFDFKINLKNNKFILLEIDGIQHLKESWNNSLIDQQYRDKLKDEYCNNNHYQLFRINYNGNGKNEKIKNKLLDELSNILKNFEIA